MSDQGMKGEGPRTRSIPGARAWRVKMLAVVAGVLILALPASSSAQSEATKLFEKAREQFDFGEFRRSLKTLKKALAQNPVKEELTRIHLYMGLNNAVIKRADKAREQFTKALWHDPGLVLDAEQFKPSLVEMFNQIKQSLRGELVVASKSEGARVLIDGKDVGGVGKVPFEIDLPLGQHLLQVVSADKLARSEEKEIRIQPGEKLRIEPALIPVTGSIQLDSTPPGATIILDGRPTDTAPAQLEVSPGRHALRLTLDGYHDWVREVEVREGEVTDFKAALEELPPPPPPTSPWLRGYRLWSLVAGGLAIASTGVGIGFAVSGSADESDFKSGGSGDPEQNITYDRADELKSSAEGKMLTANIAFGLAGALAATAVTLFFVEPQEDWEEAGVSVRLAPTGSTGAVLWGGIDW